jgi:prophage regulatory protein
MGVEQTLAEPPSANSAIEVTEIESEFNLIRSAIHTAPHILRPVVFVGESAGDVEDDMAISKPIIFKRAGFLRLSSILARGGPIPVSKSTWWVGVKVGCFPRPLKLGQRITVWRTEDIEALIENGVG